MFLAEVWDVMHEVELSWTCEIHDLVFSSEEGARHV